MRKLVTVALFVLASVPLLAGIDGKKAMYVGGTVAGLAEKMEGRFNLLGDTEMTFTPDKKGASPASIAYASIAELEYGQKAGRRVGVAVMVSPLALFSKKRNHYLTIAYKDSEGKDQAGVFELGKDIVRASLKVLEARTGKRVTFQDEEARKSLGGGK